MEQEFNQGKPPAGEAGMLLYRCGGRWDWKYSRGDGDFGVGSLEPRIAFASRLAGNYESPGKAWRWATLADLTAAGLTEAEALLMLHESQRPDDDTESMKPPVVKRVKAAVKPATSESDRDIDIGDGIDPQQRMLDRDNAGMPEAEPVPVFELVLEPEEAPGLLVVAPLDRIGGGKWGL